MKISKVNENIKIQNTEAELDKNSPDSHDNMDNSTIKNHLKEDIIIDINLSKNRFAMESENLVYKKEDFQGLEMKAENIYKKIISSIESSFFDQDLENKDLNLRIHQGLVKKALQKIPLEMEKDLIEKIELGLKTAGSLEFVEETRTRINEFIGREIHRMIGEDKEKPFGSKEQNQAKYPYLYSLFWPGDFESKKISSRTRQVKSLPYLVLIILGLIVYYGLKSFGKL